jgi:hypothetical protein
MSTHSRYEETDQQFNDLPLPDEEASWQKMEALLDEDEDDDRIIPPPVFFRSCLGWGLLFAGLIVGWMVLRPDKKWNENSKEKPLPSSNKTVNQKNTTTNSVSKPKYNSIKPNRTSQSAAKVATATVVQKQKNKEVKNALVITSKPTKDALINQTKKKVPYNPVPEKKSIDQHKKNKSAFPNEVIIQSHPGDTSDIILQNSKNKNTDTSSAVPNQYQALKTDTARQVPVNDSSAQKKIQLSKKKSFLTAGIGEQQQIPIAGQTAVPYSHYGRKGSLSDYVPSVYLRWQKNTKWFVQGEFRYGAAQSVKELPYNRKTKFDSTDQSITITTLRLKKTYYHQFPLSINYYVRPNLSVGIGGMYSRFYGAVTEKETDVYHTLTQTVTNFKQIIPVKHFTDSFLYKTQIHLLMQADYEWKKFSFGLRYTKDIQPYIKYTRPDGTVDEERNQSLQLMVRYRLWQSKRI